MPTQAIGPILDLDRVEDTAEETVGWMFGSYGRDDGIGTSDVSYAIRTVMLACGLDLDNEGHRMIVRMAVSTAISQLS